MSKLPSHRNRFEIVMTNQALDRLEDAARVLSTDEDGVRVMEDLGIMPAARGQSCRTSAVVEAGAMQLVQKIEKSLNRIRASKK